jgi:hypothetical protein
MVFTATNNAKGEVLGWLSISATTLTLKSGQWALFPATWPFRLTLEKIVNDVVTQREIVEASARSWDVLTITRWVEACPASDIATTQTTTSFSFDDWDVVSLYVTANLYDHVDTLDAQNVKLTGNQTIGWVKTFTSSPVIPDGTSATDPITKSQLDSAVFGAWNTNSLTDKDGIAWENIAFWDLLYDEYYPTFAEATSVQAIGNTASNTRTSVTIYWSGVAWNRLKFAVREYWTTTVDLWVRLETDNSWVPSWTLVDANASIVLDRSKLDTTLRESYIPVVDAYGSPLTSLFNATWTRGVKIQAKITGKITGITKQSSSSADTVFIYNSLWTLVYTAPIGSTLNFPIIANEFYYVETGLANLASAQRWWSTSNVTYPLVRTNIDMVAWSVNWVALTGTLNISYFDVVNITTTADFPAFASNITINRWTKCHMVLFQWTYWSETIDGTNYYWVWFNAVETTTRRIQPYSWSAYSLLYDATVTDTDDITFTSTEATTQQRWYVIRSKFNQIITVVTKSATSTATRAIIKDFAWNTLATQAFSWNDATLATPLLLGKGVLYRVELDNSWSSYTSHRLLSPSTTAKIRTNIDYLRGSAWWVNSDVFYNIDSINTRKVTDAFVYVNSVIVADPVLSKTDATLLYKTPKTLPKISFENKNSWQICKSTYYGVSNALSGLSLAPYYVWNLVGQVSLTPWTNRYIVGIWLATGELFVDWKAQNRSIAVWSSPTSFTNNTGKTIQVKITWWTVSSVTINAVTVASATNSFVILLPWEVMIITYTWAPTVSYSDL